jgi:hypothetical protein
MPLMLLSPLGTARNAGETSDFARSVLPLAAVKLPLGKDLEKSGKSRVPNGLTALTAKYPTVLMAIPG